MNRKLTSIVTVTAGLLSLSACNMVPHVIQTRIETNQVECPVERCPADPPSQPAPTLSPEIIKDFTTPAAPQAPGPEPERFAQQPATQSVGHEPDPGRP